MVPVRELMREKARGGNGAAGLEAARREGFKVRPLELDDFKRHDSHQYAHVDPSARKAVARTYLDPVD
jgi:hypothetical protein